MPYVAEKPRLPRSTAQLRHTIPGWGADLDPANRPAVPREVFDPEASGAHWHFPQRQLERWPREKSTEHRMLTPVFGTACPPKGLSGVIRKLAYARYSEGQLRHWLLLVFADRVDVIESRVTGVLRGRPDNIFTESGIRTEFTHHGLRARMEPGRRDLRHLPVDLLLTGGTTILAAWLAVAAGRRLAAGGRRLMPARAT